MTEQPCAGMSKAEMLAYLRRQQNRFCRSTENEFQPLQMRVASHDQEVIVRLLQLFPWRYGFVF